MEHPLRPFILAVVIVAVWIFAISHSARALVNSNENALDELGQFASTTTDTTLSWTTSRPNNGAASANALGFSGPGNSAIDPVKHFLYVADSINNRVLVYNLNTDNSLSAVTSGHTADFVLGQSSFTATLAATTTSGMSDPLDLAVDTANNRLFVADYGNTRVTMFNTTTLSNGMKASSVLGATNFTGSCTGCTGQNSLGLPIALAYDAAHTRLFVADLGSNRVMVFSVPPGFTNGENASNVIGQTDFIGSSSDHTATTLFFPDALAYDAANTRLFVADSANNRVMVYNVALGFVTTGLAASYALGSTLTAVGSGTCTASTFHSPGGVAYDSNPGHNTLFVGDFANSRVLVFNADPAYLSTGENASYVLGSSSTPASFTSCSTNTTQNTFDDPLYLMYSPYNSHLYVDDTNANRIMIFDGGTNPTEKYYLP